MSQNVSCDVSLVNFYSDYLQTFKKKINISLSKMLNETMYQNPLLAFFGQMSHCVLPRFGSKFSKPLEAVSCINSKMHTTE